MRRQRYETVNPTIAIKTSRSKGYNFWTKTELYFDMLTFRYWFKNRLGAFVMPDHMVVEWLREANAK